MCNSLAVDHEDTLLFFIYELSKVTPKNLATTANRELLHSASILAHFAQTPIGAEVAMSPPTDLRVILESSLPSSSGMQDLDVLEQISASLLYTGGFFWDQMRREHGLDPRDFRHISIVGSGLYKKAYELEWRPGRRRLFKGMSENFTSWAWAFCQINRNSINNHYLVRP